MPWPLLVLIALSIVTSPCTACLGGDNNGEGCPDLLLDIAKGEEIRAYEAVIDDQLKVVHPESPRYDRLQAEKRAIRRYYDVSAP